MQDLIPYREQFLDRLLVQDLQGGIAVIDAAIQAGFPPKTILLKVVSPAMDHIGTMQANREITLSEVFVVARISDAAIDRLVRVLDSRSGQTLEDATAQAVIVGSAEGDYHSLGRKIVCSFLRMGRFRVIDLGASVSAQRFVDATMAEQAPVICVSALLLHTAERVKEIRALLHERSLEDQIKLVVGGAVFNIDRELYRLVGADATAVNAPGAVTVVRSLIRGGS